MRGIGPGIGWTGVGGTFRLALVFLATSGMANAAEHITLINGFDLMCDHRSVLGDKVRLYLDAASANFVEVRAEEIAASEHVDLPMERGEKSIERRSAGRWQANRSGIA